MSILIDRLRRYADLVDEWDAFAEACQRPLPLVLWANPAQRDALARLNLAEGVGGDDLGSMLKHRLESRGYRCRELPWYHGAFRVDGLEKPGRTLEYHLGIYHVQEEVSLVPAVAMEPQPKERVLDLCAAPGGKTAQVAVMMALSGTLVANDVRSDRLRALRGNAERLGLLNVVVTANDGVRFPLGAGPFDRILLDVPCSCEGNVRRAPSAAFPDQGSFLTGRSGLQATLLGRAWKLLRPGGTLVYATCTFAPEENEMVLDHVLKADAEILPFSVPGLDASGGVTEWEGRTLRADCANVARFWPHLNDTGGFTVAVARKRSENVAVARKRSENVAAGAPT